MRLTGPFLAAVPGSGVSFRQNLATVEGTVSGNQLSLEGSAFGEGRVGGVNFTCS